MRPNAGRVPCPSPDDPGVGTAHRRWIVISSWSHSTLHRVPRSDADECLLWKWEQADDTRHSLLASVTVPPSGRRAFYDGTTSANLGQTSANRSGNGGERTTKNGKATESANANKDGPALGAIEQYGEEQSCSTSPRTLVCHGASRPCRRHSASVAPFAPVARPVFPLARLQSLHRSTASPG